MGVIFGMNSLLTIVGVCLVVAGCSPPPTDVGEAGNGPRLQSEVEPSVEPVFRETYSGSGRNENGFPFSFYVYEGPNNESVGRKFEVYETDDLAERRYAQILRTGTPIGKEEDLLRNGEPVGRKATIRDEKAQPPRPGYKTIVHFGSRIHILEADSLELLADFGDNVLTWIAGGLQHEADRPSQWSDPCQKYQGGWEVQTYKGNTTESEVICNGAPCKDGNWEGYLRVSCDDNKLSGTVILGFSSVPAPGKEASVPLDIFFEDPGVIFSYHNQRQCKIEYDVRPEGEFLVGSFSSKDCKYKASYETDAEFAEGTSGGVVLIRN